MHPNALHLPVLFDLLGIFTSSAAGALTGIRKSLDLVGVAVLAAVTGLGGGVIRDLMIGAVPPAALTDWRYLTLAAVAAVLVIAAHSSSDRLPERLRGRLPLAELYLYTDAVCLGAFAVSGTVKALTYGLASVPAALMGVVTAVGGGVIRDMLVNEVPTVLRREIYALPAALASLIIAAAYRYEPAATPLAFLAAAAAATLRVVSVQRDWHARVPTPHQ